MHSLGWQAHELLTWAGVSMQPGLTETEFSAIEACFGVTFNRSHREFLALGVPVGPGWPDWRSGAEAPLRAWVDWPITSTVRRSRRPLVCAPTRIAIFRWNRCASDRVRWDELQVEFAHCSRNFSNCLA